MELLDMKPQSLLFTIYGEYVRHYGSEIWVGSLTKLMGEFGMTEQAVRAAISRMQKQGWIESRKVGNRSFYSMSARGKKRLNEAAERIYKVENGEWNGKWCITSYTIPEEQRNLRDELRKELNFLGFAMLTNSTWISPNDLTERVRDITQSYEITDYVEVFSAEHLGWSDPKKLVKKCWNLDEINQAYREFIDTYQPKYDEFVQLLTNKQELHDNQCFVEKTELVHQYRKFLFIDPDLPQQLLPDVWLGKDAARLFRNYYNLLDPGAVRFFKEAYEPIPK
jgi:phenylacetic acid degradation operon negative regulatory protein